MNTTETPDLDTLLGDARDHAWKRVEEVKGLCRVLAGVHGTELEADPDDIASVADLICHHLEDVSTFLDDLDEARMAAKRKL